MAEGFTCAVYEASFSACEGLPFYGEYEDKRYCVLHYPGEEKKAGFESAVESKLAQRDYNFRRTVFPAGTSDFQEFEFDGYADFNNAIFLGEALFSTAKFRGVVTDFSGVQFGGLTSFPQAQFSGEYTHFAHARFHSEGTYFSGAQFSSSKVTDFSRAQFSGERTIFSSAQFFSPLTSFIEAQFSGAETYFQETSFTKDVDFRAATFKEKGSFWGSKVNPVFDSGAWAQFNRCRIEKPDQFTFDTVLLHPGWFCNTDARKVDFTDVKWYGMRGGQGTLDEEIIALEERDVDSPHTLLAQACRRLSANAEENHEYPLANDFHYWSMDALRKESWDYRKESWNGLAWIRRNWFRVAKRWGLATTLRLVWVRISRRRRSRPRSFGLITTLYWASSGYGVRAARAFWILFAIWLIFAALYFLLVKSSPFWVFSASNIWQGIDYARQAAAYSLSALVRLNPRPPSEELNWFQTLATIEGILGPLQIALLALAVRRRVMR